MAEVAETPMLTMDSGAKKRRFVTTVLENTYQYIERIKRETGLSRGQIIDGLIPSKKPLKGIGALLAPDPEIQGLKLKVELKEDREFDEFWELYRRKPGQRVSKKDAGKAWRQTKKDRPPFEELMEALRGHKRSAQWNNPSLMVPYAATWLRGHRWRDVLPPRVPKQAHGRQHAKDRKKAGKWDF